jgi:hypothetical protein
METKATDPKVAGQPELVDSVLQVVQRVVTRQLLVHAWLKADERQSDA